MDKISPEKRSWLMSRIKGKDTSPEIRVRSLLHRLGFRFRIQRRDLPGKPDIVLPKYRTIIFVHGCFWHQHQGCKHSHIPQSNVSYLESKLSRNVLRDIKNKQALEQLGWKVVVIWECETKNIEKLAEEISEKIKK